jgi:predicted nucleic acid-binding protein
MIVVDTNVIGYLYLTSDRSAQAEQAFRKDPHWVALQKEPIPCPTG